MATTQVDPHARIADLIEENHRLKIQIEALKEENGMLGAECLEAEKERLAAEQVICHHCKAFRYINKQIRTKTPPYDFKSPPSTPPTELVELHGTDGKFEISRQRRWMND